MSETVTITATTKADIYDELFPQIQALMDDKADAVANMANVSSALKTAFPAFSWVGFYLMQNGELIVGPFQGKPACVRIEIGRGVCGTAYERRETLIVPDVHAFPGHIACDPDSRSEIVVPLVNADMCYGVLDVDSYEKNAFDDTDAMHLAHVTKLIIPFLRKEERYG